VATTQLRLTEAGQQCGGRWRLLWEPLPSAQGIESRFFGGRGSATEQSQCCRGLTSEKEIQRSIAAANPRSTRPASKLDTLDQHHSRCLSRSVVKKQITQELARQYEMEVRSGSIVFPRQGSPASTFRSRTLAAPAHDCSQLSQPGVELFRRHGGVFSRQQPAAGSLKHRE
jgi:hypothetical protein